MTETAKQPGPPRQPSIARVYDYLLGGKDNYAVDRVIGDHFKIALPGSVEIALSNRRALVRAVREMAQSGLRQFIDFGSGLPTVDNVHQVAQRHASDARVVYVDNDPIVVSYGRALLVTNGNTAVIEADVCDPEQIAAHRDLARLIDFGQPVAVLFSAILHHLKDDEDPAGIVAYWAGRLPAGSRVFISHFRSGRNNETAAVENKLQAAFGRGRWRTDDEIRALFGDLELLEPGIVPAARWRLDGYSAERVLTSWEELIVAGLASTGPAGV